MNDKLCWIEINSIYEKAIIKQINKNYEIVVEYKNKHLIVKKKNVYLRNSDEQAYCNNLINLKHLNNASILQTINLRYLNNNIYTYNDNILIALNPFKKLNIYNSIIINKYKNTNFKEPHVFLQAKKALINLKKQKNQSILISGESGSGKTQSTKYIMKYITSCCKTTTKYISSKILASNNILEAFGNAKTIKNNNSSRFGKFIKLLFNSNLILVGAEIKTYLLEKIRVTNISNKERNYHIFYILLNNLSFKQKCDLFIENSAEKYCILNKSKCTNAIECNNEIYNSLIKSFEILNFTNEDINYIFKIIAVILNFGNIEHLKNLENNIFLINSSKLLKIDKNNLIDLLKYKYIYPNNETIRLDNNLNDFNIIKKSFCMSMYEYLFNHIVLKINKNIYSSYNYYIGILDIFGFEIFKNNGFEQLCINYTNEKLQQLFNHYIFELKQREYKSENIEWTDIEYPNNKDIISLINNKKKSIFSLLTEQCILKNGSDKAFYTNIYKILLYNNNLKINSSNKYNNQLTISHYAGDVLYNIHNFIIKNKNIHDIRIINIIKNTNLFINNNTNNNKSVIINFNKNLNSLIKIISNTDQHYLRCKKTNDYNKPNNFNKKGVIIQLKYCGILEAIKIARKGYPIIILIKIFINNFFSLFNFYKISNKLENISILLNKIQIIKNYKLGLTKIFFKKHTYETIIYHFNKITKIYSTKIRNFIQMIIKREKYRKYIYYLFILQNKWKTKIVIKKKASKIIKYFILTKILNKKYKFLYNKIISCQSIIRYYLVYKKVYKLKLIIKIQAFWRMFINKIKYKVKFLKYKSVKIIQKFFKITKFKNTINANLKKIININNKISHYKNELQIMQLRIKEKDLIIKNLYEENYKLKNVNKSNINNSYINDIINHKNFNNKEIALKMKKLYIQLNNAEDEINILKNYNNKCNIM